MEIVFASARFKSNAVLFKREIIQLSQSKTRIVRLNQLRIDVRVFEYSKANRGIPDLVGEFRYDSTFFIRRIGAALERGQPCCGDTSCQTTSGSMPFIFVFDIR